jgi:hypothetical protein
MVRLVNVSKLKPLLGVCPNAGETRGLTLLLYGKNNKNNKNPHPNSPSYQKNQIAHVIKFLILIHSSLLILHPPLFAVNHTPFIIHSASFNFQPYSRGLSLTSKKSFLFYCPFSNFICEVLKITHVDVHGWVHIVYVPSTSQPVCLSPW